MTLKVALKVVRKSLKVLAHAYLFLILVTMQGCVCGCAHSGLRVTRAAATETPHIGKSADTWHSANSVAQSTCPTKCEFDTMQARTHESKQESKNERTYSIIR